MENLELQQVKQIKITTKNPSDILKKYNEAKELERRAKELLATAKTDLEVLFDQAGDEVLTDEFRATRKMISSQRIDSAKFKKEMPEIYARFCAETVSVRIDVKAI